MKITLNEALGWKKTLAQRHGELVRLRDTNSSSDERYYGEKSPVVTKKPTYDAVKLDRQITALARESRLLDMAIKRTNAKAIVDAYEQDDKILGELEDVTSS